VTNTEKVLDYIRAGHVHDAPPPEFSLNAVRSMPDDLFLPMAGPVIALAESNAELPALRGAVESMVLSQNVFGKVGTTAKSGIPEKIETIRKGAADGGEAEWVDRAVANYEQYGFFSQFDWRLAHWGTIEDVHSVTPATFKPPTSHLEFTTLWTPPVAAMQELANTFPSVRFKLKYRYASDEPWIVEDLFAFPPFGY
jgi:hypothetical protein